MNEKKIHTYLTQGNNPIVYHKVFTRAQNEILLASYSLESTYLSFATTEMSSRTRA